MPFRIDRFRPFWPGLLVLFASGCGVAAYEAKMAEAQARMKHLEEETTLLDAPLVMPQGLTKEGAKVPMANVFLRPPIGIESRALNEGAPDLGLFYRYKARDKAPAAATLVELAFSSDQKNFAGDVFSAIGGTNKPQTRQRVVRVPGRENVTIFETTEFADGENLISVNVWRGPRSEVAVVYRFAKEQRVNAEKIVDLSLGTFGVDAEADRLRTIQGQHSMMQPPGHK